ncbi:MAG: DUF455 family protein [Myxococcales bacterium]|nr:DUF455 family protein [Myxococcales bacterium]
MPKPAHELFAFAARVLQSDALADKLAPPPRSTASSGTPMRLAAPVRPATLQMVPAKLAKVPPPQGLTDPHQRVRILHALANHELQAVELFAWAMLAFADMPPAFHHGLRGILEDEQRHFRLYEARLADDGVAFGDLPVSGHFWNMLDELTTPARFLAVMGLTFENANLDFAQAYRAVALAKHMPALAEVFEIVHREEIAHVRFAYHWLQKLVPGDGWDAYVANLPAPLTPVRARGKEFDVAARHAAGLDDAFIARLARATSVA